MALPADAEPPQIRIMHYGADELAEVEPASLDDVQRYLSATDSVTWVDVRGLGDAETLKAIAASAGMHPLARADVANVPQRPKSEDYEEHQFVVVRMPAVDGRRIVTEQVSLVVGPRFVVSFQEREGDVFDAVRQRLRQGRGPIRRSGPDYLAYALIDMVIDAYYPLVEAVGELVEELEEEVITSSSAGTLRRIYALKRLVQELRRTVWPHRDALAALLRDESPFVGASVRVYLRDTYDHAMQLLDVLEGYRETATGLLDVYLSTQSNKTNEVMRMLTVMASIFIPLTFIAGVYGMNFDAMPELHARMGYPLVLGVMAITAGAMLIYFRRRGWLGEPDAVTPARSSGGLRDGELSLSLDRPEG